MNLQDNRSSMTSFKNRAQQTTQITPSKKQGRSKVHWVLWVGIAAGVVLPSILVVGLFNRNKPPISRVVPAPVVAAQSVSTASIAQEGTTAPSSAARVITPVQKMNLMPAENMTPNFVDHVGAENGVRIIYFRDGSKRNLDDFILQQLPAATRSSITYSRGSDANP
jgi:hypothetical protein